MRGLRAIDWFVPDAIRARGADALRRARLAVGASGLAALAFLWTSVEQIAWGVPEVGRATAASVPLLAALPLLIRRSGSMAAVAHALPLLLYLFCLGLGVATAGRATGTLLGAVVVPLIAVLLGGRRAGAAWCVLTCVGLAGVGAAAGAELPFAIEAPLATDPGAPIRAAILAALGVTGVGAIYESLHQRALRDLTSAHARADAAARQRLESERRFRTLTENASDVITEWDETGFIYYISPQIEAFTGSPPERFIDTHWLEHVDRIHRDDVDPFRLAIERVVGGESVSDVAFRFRHEDGSWRSFELVFRPFRTADGHGRMVSVGRDVTDRREVETLRRLTRQLEETASELARANRDLEEFTSVASHDLQEPLRKLLAFSELLRQDLGGELPPDAERDLAFIQEGAARMRSLVEDLLALSRTGIAPMKPARVSVDACLDRALERLALRIEETGAEITRASLPELRADATLLTEIFQNLIANALQFGGGRSPRIRISAERHQAGWTLGVGDEGIGVAPEHSEAIFEPFRRLDPADPAGSGIGLAICRKAVERHGGRIWVESEPGRGAHFRFTLGA